MFKSAAMLALATGTAIDKCEWADGVLTVSWSTQESDYYEVQVAHESEGDMFAVFSTAETQAAIDFLAENRSYWLKVRSHVASSPSLGPGNWRDVGDEVECKTGTGARTRAASPEKANTMALEVLRQSEFTYDVDYLMNHNSGDIGGDTSFVVSSSANPDQPDFLNTTFRKSVFTLYCLEVLKVDVPNVITTGGDSRFADYLSCNDNHNATDPQCECDNWIDRYLSKPASLTDHCKRSDGSACAASSWNRDCSCECSASSLEYSAKYVGMMPVYYGQSELLGHWYSTPKEAECGDGETVGQQRADGSICTWKRSREARVVRGGDVLEHGWNASVSREHDVPPALIKQNTAVFRNLFDSQPFQQWSCASQNRVVLV